MTMRESDWDTAEKLRVAMGLRSCSAVIRQVLREEAKRRGIG